MPLISTKFWILDVQLGEPEPVPTVYLPQPQSAQELKPEPTSASSLQPVPVSAEEES